VHFGRWWTMHFQWWSHLIWITSKLQIIEQNFVVQCRRERIIVKSNLDWKFPTVWEKNVRIFHGEGWLTLYNRENRNFNDKSKFWPWRARSKCPLAIAPRTDKRDNRKWKIFGGLRHFRFSVVVLSESLVDTFFELAVVENPRFPLEFDAIKTVIVSESVGVGGYFRLSVITASELAKSVQNSLL